MRRLLALLLVALIDLACPWIAEAHEAAAPKSGGAVQQPAKPPASGPPKMELQTAPAQQVMPDPERILMLVRTTLVALNHANLTGNYTVLRDLGAPGFSRANSAAKLSAIFQNFRSPQLDLSPVTVVTPELDLPPSFTPDGKLRLKGHFPTRPLRINFEMLFERIEARWLLFGLAANPVPAASAETANPPANSQKK